jgi:hypothetical protein
MEEKTNYPPRPIWNDEMTEELAQITGKIVNDWCNNETSLEDCIESARKVLKWNRGEDGYQLAKEFEDEGFCSDSDLVSELELVELESEKILKKFIEKWVVDNNLKLDLPIGQKVTAKLNRKDEEEFEIVNLRPETMRYGLWNEKLGEKGKRSYLVDFEKIINVI